VIGYSIHFVLEKVLNIIAELKLPRRKEVITMLKIYGFRCLKYAESYNMYLRSDHYMKIENGRMVFDRADHTASRQSVAFHGILCDEPPTGNYMVDIAEVNLLLPFNHLAKTSFKKQMMS
jgi:hypothetical protein